MLFCYYSHLKIFRLVGEKFSADGHKINAKNLRNTGNDTLLVMQLFPGSHGRLVNI